jgi:hypothetical protein
MQGMAMRVSRIILGLSVFVLAATPAFTKVRIDFDRSVNFSKYRTFMWLQEPDPNNPFMKPRIINSVNAQLIGKGLEPDTTDADLVIRATSTIEKIPIWNTYYSGGFGGWGGCGACGWSGCGACGWGGGSGWATTTMDIREEGTLVVELLDARTHQPVWRGVATHSVSSKPEKAAEKLQKEIRKMFEKYPPERDS